MDIRSSTVGVSLIGCGALAGSGPGLQATGGVTVDAADKNKS